MQYKHMCTLDPEHQTNIFKKCQNILLKVSKVRQISLKNPRTKFYFRSIAAVEKERKRHLNHYSSYIIHPFSLFRVFWELSFIFIFYSSLLVSPISSTFLRHSVVIATHELLDDPIEKIELIFDLLSLADILVTFLTGCCILNKKEVILSPKGIAKAYMSSWALYRDILASAPFFVIGCMLCIYFPVLLDNADVRKVIQVFPLLKVFRLSKCLEYLDNTAEFARHYHYLVTIIKYLMIIILCSHWLTCVYVGLIQLDVLHENDEVYKFSMTNGLLEFDSVKTYTHGLLITLSYLLGISLVNGFMYNSHYLIDENRTLMILFILYSVIGFILCNLFTVLLLQLIMSMQSSEIKYYSIISQLTQYMEHKELPRKVAQRIISYYEYRFQNKYFREASILAMLSDTLKRDINMHTCRSLIENVSLLKHLPTELINEVVLNLKYEVFLYNDIIVKAGTSGECMYFISSGTVAVSTPTGKEICHLQDGGYFGEIALVSKEQKRVANVVAIEICEIYRLDRRSFKNCFAFNSVHYKKVEQIARERMEKTILLEELHKKYILERTTKRIAEANKK